MLRKAIGYAITLTSSLYAFLILILFTGVEFTLINRLLIALTGLFISYIIGRIFYGSLPKARFNLRAIEYTLTLLMPLYAFSLIGTLYIGVDKFYDMARPGFVESWNPILVPYSIAFWTINGVFAAYFFDVIPYELFSKKGKLLGILAAILIFAINYNSPLVSGYWNAEDIIFFGAAFVYSYSVNKSPLSLVIVYLISEAPLWWCLLAPLGKLALFYYLVGRLAISIIALLHLLLTRKTLT